MGAIPHTDDNDMAKMSVPVYGVERQNEVKQERPLGQRKTPPPTNSLRDIQMKVVIIYVYHTDLLPLKIRVTLTLTFQGHSRSDVMVTLDSLYMVSY